MENIKNAPEREQIKTLLNPTSDTAVCAGELIMHDDYGIGLVVGFSSKTNNPDIYFYREQKIICINISSIY